MKWQDLLEEEKNGRTMFRIGAKIHFSEKNILVFSSHFKGNYVENVIAFSNKRVSCFSVWLQFWIKSFLKG